MMKHLFGIAMGLLLFCAVKLAGAGAFGCATLKKVEHEAAACVLPTGEQAAATFAQCKSQGGDDKLCGMLASHALIDFIECVWKAHVAGKCEPACPFHTSAPDGGT